MKKWIVAVVAVLVVAFIFLNFILPSNEKVVVTKNVKASSATIYRAISSQHSWDKLFPGDFAITKKLLNTVHIKTSVNNKSSEGHIFLVPLTNDSCLVRWETKGFSSGGFFDRIQGFRLTNRLEKKLVLTIDSIKSFCSSTVNTYGFQIVQRSTTDTLLVTTKFTTSSYPSNLEIYSQIIELKKFVASKKAKQSGHPMLHVSTTDSSSYKCMVGLPIDRTIETDYNSPIQFVRMIPGQFLTTDIKGGPHSINKAHQMMELYFQDYQRTAMAVPFEYLITNRIDEADTTKWITKLYAPVY